MEEQKLLEAKETEETIETKETKPKHACAEYVPVILLPYKSSKLKKITNGNALFEKDAQVYQAMLKVHLALDGAKNLFFYILKSNGKYVKLSHESKFEVLFRRYKSPDGALRIYYNNDYIGSSKCVDNLFYAAQGIMVVYVLGLGYHYLYTHGYI